MKSLIIISIIVVLGLQSFFSNYDCYCNCYIGNGGEFGGGGAGATF